MRTQPPGPNGLPVVGNTYHYARDPFDFMAACREAYGDVVRLDMGGREAYLLTHPDTIGRVLVEDDEKFTKARFRDDAVERLLGQGMLLSEGDLWRQQRRLAQPAFGMDRLRDLGELVTDRTASLLSGWEDGDVVDVHGEMATVTVQIITEVLFDAELTDDRAERVREALEPVGERFEPDPRRVLIPDWMPTEENRIYDDAVATLDEVVEEFVTERRRRGYAEGDDLLAILLRAVDEGTIEAERLRDELVTMLLAGHDTTALALTYTWYLLDEHPEARERLHDELDSVLGGATPTVEDLPRLDYTERLLQESMRLYPPVYSLFRQPKLDVRLDGYRIPEGAVLFLPQWVVHRDPRWWDEPDQFDPDRWIGTDADRPQYAYFPFGAGPRHCIGKHLSMMEGQLILATVAQAFELERVASGPLDRRGSITMHPRDPVDVRLRER
ncbi:cytochrome P450 [Halorientalis salina]|uniref:cytochrome P450 n=1 Tax=Halorientalis salina TaxID=2932266 RepID=UPI0010AD357A|nr:cytochrome P450 [Halorientalis salina]